MSGRGRFPVPPPNGMWNELSLASSGTAAVQRFGAKVKGGGLDPVAEVPFAGPPSENTAL